MSTRKKEPKSLQMSFRVTEKFRDALIALAERENRSHANMLECLVLEQHSRTFGETRATIGAATKTTAAKRKAVKRR